MHYQAIPAEGRLLIPDIAVLRGLRHRWVWEKRARPHVLVWSFAKMPKTDISPEENARMLCVYMRPWTLDKEAACIDVPFLGEMREVRPRETSSDGHESLHADAVAAFRSTAEAGKRRRLRQWTSPPLHLTPPLLSYVLSWMRYIDGNVVS